MVTVCLVGSVGSWGQLELKLEVDSLITWTNRWRTMVLSTSNREMDSVLISGKLGLQWKFTRKSTLPLPSIAIYHERAAVDLAMTWPSSAMERERMESGQVGRKTPDHGSGKNWSSVTGWQVSLFVVLKIWKRVMYWFGENWNWLIKRSFSEHWNPKRYCWKWHVTCHPSPITITTTSIPQLVSAHPACISSSLHCPF
jgi:hypothetical protein